MSKKHECIVCGRKFPEGQGILIDLGGTKLAFHSKSCALKFFKTLFLRVEYSLIRDYVNETIEEFRRKVSEERKRKAKKI